jgi:hypothetical protein
VETKSFCIIVMKSLQIVVSTCSHSQDKLTSMADAGKVLLPFFSVSNSI